MNINAATMRSTLCKRGAHDEYLVMKFGSVMVSPSEYENLFPLVRFLQTRKRKGLKIILSIGEKTGEAVMRRVDHGPDVRNILRRALETAAQAAGTQFSVEDGGIYLEV
jgi:hypothetical protein